MALRLWNVREALIAARDNHFLPRAVDATLSGAEQALCGEAANACDRAINALGVDDTMPAGQRSASYVDCLDKVHSLATVDGSHYFDNAGPLYDGMDLLYDAATVFNVGLTTFFSSVQS